MFRGKKKKELSHTRSCIISVLKVPCDPRWGWQVRCVQDELQMRGSQPRSPVSQNSSITSLLHNPNRTVHFLKNKTKQIQSDFSKEPENIHFYVLYIRVVFFRINKYKFGGQKRTKKTKTMISRGIIMNVLGVCLNQ